MPRFLIERNFADELEITKDDVDRVKRINDETGVKMADLVFKCRQEEDLLPLRGAERRGDPPGGQARECTCRRNHRSHSRVEPDDV
jgi:hypothetical protein